MEAAAEYEDDMRSSFRLEADQLPRFDLVLLGMGAEGQAETGKSAVAGRFVCGRDAGPKW
jgi:hypothetical protein